MLSWKKKSFFFLFLATFLCGCFQSTIAQTRSTDKITSEEIFTFTGSRDYIYLFNWSTKKCKNTRIKGHDPALSPDGKKIVFAVVKSYTGGIFVMNIDGSDKKKITKGSYERVMSRPQWSPDGKKIFFIASRYNRDKEEWIWGIYVMNIDGTEETLVKATEGSYFDLSPDGTKIAFKGSNGLYIMNSDGTDDKTIYKKSGAIRWSPNGKKIVFSDGWNLYTIDPDGSDLKLIVKQRKSSVFGPIGICVWTWTPDSKKIIYVESAEGPFMGRFWIINTDGTDRKPWRWH